jgi:hypothetical protein
MKTAIKSPGFLALGPHACTADESPDKEAEPPKLHALKFDEQPGREKDTLGLAARVADRMRGGAAIKRSKERPRPTVGQTFSQVPGPLAAGIPERNQRSA